MRIIKIEVLRDYWAKHPDAEASLSHWYNVAKAAQWSTLAETRATFPHADPVTVRSGKTTTVFNIAGNKYRLVVWVNYAYRVVYIRFIGTHAQYDKIDVQTI